MQGEGPWRWWDEGGGGEDRKVNLREKAKELKADIPVIYLVLCVIVKIFR